MGNRQIDWRRGEQMPMWPAYVIGFAVVAVTVSIWILKTKGYF
ncbi:hypothetical protein [Blautia sp. An249]|nr:hypothetical protein [Blautia sp. An249]